MKVLITGGSGFIGTNLALHILSLNNVEVKVLDNFYKGSRSNLDNFAGEIIHGDILKIKNLLKQWNPDVIFHQAAITDTTILDEQLLFETNVKGFRTVLDYAAGCEAKVVYASSAAIYGVGATPMTESQTPSPHNLYGKSKLVAEHLAEKYRKKCGLITIGLRYFNVYGPKEHHKGKMASMIWQLALQMVSGKRPRIFKWGQQKRDQIYVEDVVRANMLALHSNVSGVYNVGTGKAVSFNDIVSVLNEVLGYSYEPDYFDNPYGFYQNTTLADVTKTRQILGFKAEYDLRRGVEDYLKKIDIMDFILD